MEKTSDYQIELEKEIALFASSPESNLTSLINKIYKYKYPNYTDDYGGFGVFIRQQSNKYLDLAIEEYHATSAPELQKEVLEITLHEFNRRYDILIKLGDKDSFDVVAKNAEDFLKGEDYLDAHGYQYEDGQVLLDFIQAYYNPVFKDEVVAFFEEAFDFSKTYALQNKKWDYLSGDPDDATLLALVHALNSLEKEDRELFANLVFEIYKFCTSDERSYGLNQASGFIALLLPTYDQLPNIEVLNNAIEITGEHYKTDAFVHQTLYAKWMLSNDPENAFEYLRDQENEKGATFAIMALADLNYAVALPLLESKLAEEKHPIVIEVLAEAIKRLKDQTVSQKVEERMIWLNGNVTPTQRATGTESNNVFLKRANEKQNIDDTVYETDDD